MIGIHIDCLSCEPEEPFHILFFYLMLIFVYDLKAAGPPSPLLMRCVLMRSPFWKTFLYIIGFQKAILTRDETVSNQAGYGCFLWTQAMTSHVFQNECSWASAYAV